MSHEKCETASTVIWLGEDGILRATGKPGQDVKGADAADLIAAGLALNGGLRSPILVDLRASKSVSRDARRVFEKTGASFNSAVGFLVHSPFSRVLGSFLIGINKPDIPARLFEQENQALEWLKGYV
ncbi:MAG: STAS/SEC14 domain-containing protein [Spirochaetota bacterium]